MLSLSIPPSSRLTVSTHKPEGVVGLPSAWKGRALARGHVFSFAHPLWFPTRHLLSFAPSLTWHLARLVRI
eukprot:7409121-Pyramimonas_sp.AAC.1